MAITYEPIATYTFNTPATSYTFSSIPQTYTDLIFTISGQVATTTHSIYLRFNGDSGGNYNSTIMSGTSGGSSYKFRYTNDARLFIDFYGAPPVSPSTGIDVVHINNYTSTVMNKCVIARGNSEYGADLIGSVWKNTAAITSISVHQPTYNFTSGTTVTLYGIKAA